MENLNAEQIITALECCGGEHPCGEECFGHDIKGISVCTKILAQNALALITSQEQRIEHLKKYIEKADNGIFELQEKIKELTEEVESLTATVKVRGETIEKLQFYVTDISEDNRKLTEENERLRAEVSVKKKLLDKCVDIEDQVRADTVRKMQEMVYEFADDLNTIDAYIIKEMIDEVAKEMLEGGNNNE